MANMDPTSHAELISRIERLFAEKLNVDVPSRDTKLIDEGYLDSLLFIDLLMALEQEFGVVIELNQVDFNNFLTISVIADFIESELAHN